MDVERSDNRRWYQGPLFPYRAGKSDITVDVTLSSWPIRGLGLAKAVLSTIREFKKTTTGRVLDFGSGSWLRYLEPIRKTLQSAEIQAVEFAEAFRGDAQEVRNTYDAHVKFWTPAEFAKKCSCLFDLIVLVNVLNTMPEERHRREVFEALAKHLNPLGKLLVYQRIWAQGENPDGSHVYGDGWIVPHHSSHTYRAKTGARWFSERVKEQGLKAVPIKTTITSSNTLLAVWERPFDG